MIEETFEGRNSIINQKFTNILYGNKKFIQSISIEKVKKV